MAMAGGWVARSGALSAEAGTPAVKQAAKRAERMATVVCVAEASVEGVSRVGEPRAVAATVVASLVVAPEASPAAETPAAKTAGLEAVARVETLEAHGAVAYRVERQAGIGVAGAQATMVVATAGVLASVVAPD